ncbi:MAG: C10 family peptidase [Muribaculaceae bacterium]|nr:C10 family peptidase [Muribaculaceae bacterium]
MKKTLLLAGVAVAGISLSSQGAHVSPEEALQRIGTSTSLRAVSGKFKNTPKYQSTIGNLYLFTSSDGYLILPADDEAPALLGYSEHGAFSAKGNPGLEYWLDFYNRELSSLESAKMKSTRAEGESGRPERNPIAPLTKTKWNQEAPYNDLCPEVNGNRSVTGCVATAMAQVMKYHNWPTTGKGEHSYDWKTGGKELSFNYGTTTFDWANMTDTYTDQSTEAERNAVATLMLACGISVDMNYSPGESGASTIIMGTSLINFFDYDKGLWMPMRDYYGLYEWEDMIYSDLEKGLPVLYAGQGTAGGHQFICDGYQGDGYFHFNWGWGGMSDGYFLLTALNPANLGVGGGAGGFNSGQQVALGVQPPKEDSKAVYLMYCTSDFIPEVQTLAAGEDLSCKGGFYNYSMAEMPAGSALGMRVVASDGSYDKYLESHGTSKLPILYGYETDVIKFPSLSDGVYYITPAFYDGEKWEEMATPIGGIGRVIATVSDGVATLSSAQEASVSVSDITVPDKIYLNRDFPMSFSVVNSSDEEYVGDLIPVLVNADGETVAESVYRPVDVIAGTTEKITDYIGKFSAYQGATVSPGTYYLLFCDRAGNSISEPLEVTVAEAPTSTSVQASDFRLISPNPVKDKENVEFSFKVSCTNGYFSDSFRVVVFPYRDGQVSSVASGSSEMLYLDAGEDAEANVKLNLGSLDNGEYFAMLYLGNQTALSTQLRFSIDTETGISDIYTEIENPETIIYNLQGQRCTSPLQPGLYIVNGRKVIIK